MAASVPRISVIVISRNEGRELRLTVENLRDTLPGESEIIVVDDGSTDRSAQFLDRKRSSARLCRVKGLGVARARTFGTANAKGDILVYADAHIRTDPYWWRPLTEVLEDPSIGGTAPGMLDFGGASKAGYGLTFKNSAMDVRWHRRARGLMESLILPGAFFVTRRDVIERTGGWDCGLKQRGNVDNECCVRFWLMGYRLVITPEVIVQHKFRKSSPYPVGWPEYLFNRMRLAFVHFKAERLGKVIARLRNLPHYGEALEMIALSDIAQRRSQLQKQRVHDDDWLFERFGIHW